MAGRRVKLQALSNSLLTQDLDGYADLNLISAISGSISTSSTTGTLGTLSGTYASDYGTIALNFKEIQATVNSILTSLT